MFTFQILAVVFAVFAVFAGLNADPKSDIMAEHELIGILDNCTGDRIVIGVQTVHEDSVSIVYKLDRETDQWIVDEWLSASEFWPQYYGLDIETEEGRDRIQEISDEIGLLLSGRSTVASAPISNAIIESAFNVQHRNCQCHAMPHGGGYGIEIDADNIQLWVEFNGPNGGALLETNGTGIMSVSDWTFFQWVDQRVGSYNYSCVQARYNAAYAIVNMWNRVSTVDHYIDRYGITYGMVQLLECASNHAQKCVSYATFNPMVR